MVFPMKYSRIIRKHYNEFNKNIAEQYCSSNDLIIFLIYRKFTSPCYGGLRIIMFIALATYIIIWLIIFVHIFTYSIEKSVISIWFIMQLRQHHYELSLGKSNEHSLDTTTLMFNEFFFIHFSWLNNVSIKYLYHNI